MSGQLLVTDKLSKRFGSLTVTDDVSLTVQTGELHALIGPNGAGKTTLIHQLSGSLPSDGGRVGFDGHDITRLDMAARVRRGLARSFQITSILPGFRCWRTWRWRSRLGQVLASVLFVRWRASMC